MNMKATNVLRVIAVGLAVTGILGCVTLPGGGPSGDEPDAVSQDTVAPTLARARELYEQGDYAGALVECVDLERTAPKTKGLQELRRQTLAAISEQRTLAAFERADMAKKQATIDALEQEGIPDTFRLKRYISHEVKEHFTPESPMRQALDAPVSIHLEAGDLAAFIEAVSTDRNINMIADEGVGRGKKLTIHLDNVPLHEVMDYVSRNMGVQFYVGDNVIWVTQAGGKGGAYLETRVYRLMKGLQFHDSDWEGDVNKKKSPSTSDRPDVTFRATELSDTKSYIVDAIEQFVPQVDGSKLLFDNNTHTLLARNTSENLDLIEEIITSLDVTPPQVLIEARFIEVTAADLRELGIDWILDSPLAVTKGTVLQDGSWNRVPKTQINEGEIIRYSPYASDEEGTFPLGPQGAFGQTRSGNPSTAEQGLNLTYQGVLTKPMFRAVLHALEISGKSHTLSVPRVTTVNNNPAKLRHGDDLRFYEEFQAQAFSLVDANNQKYTITVLIPKGKPSLEELGITLVAVPSVGRDMKTISLLLVPTISKLEGFVSYQEEQATNNISQVVVKLPIISRREIQTKIIVDSGETVVMGGLAETVKQETFHRTPVLGSIPLFGKLFQRMDVTEQRRNLLVFVTATVVSERGESLLYSNVTPPESPP